MTRPLRLAIAGVGNNISALLQGIYFYRDLMAYGTDEADLPGIRNPRIGGFRVSDIEFVCAFDINPSKIGIDLSEAIVAPPNSYPWLGVDVPLQHVTVLAGIQEDDSLEPVVKSLIDTEADVLVYSLPTGHQRIVELYAQAALQAHMSFVNCTPEHAARSVELMTAFENAGLPLVGDDLASHLGTSVVHRTLLNLIREQGITLKSSYQLNFGGNEDFRNLLDYGTSKRQSKFNALAQDEHDWNSIEVIPAAAHIPHLRDNKVAVINIEGVGWGARPVSLDLTLRVQDSSNAAGVIIDLVRIAAASLQSGVVGFPVAAASVLKSPAINHRELTKEMIDQDFKRLGGVVSE